jgi:hypothetical protein
LDKPVVIHFNCVREGPLLITPNLLMLIKNVYFVVHIDFIILFLVHFLVYEIS